MADERLDAALIQYDLHSKLFDNVLEGISDVDATVRLNGQTNHIAWLAGSLLYQRFECTNLVGNPTEKPASYELFKDFKGIQEQKYPSIQEFKNDWARVSPQLRASLSSISTEKLNTYAPFKMGEHEVTVYEVIVFNMHREAYFIGQIGILRKYFGYPAMKY